MLGAEAVAFLKAASEGTRVVIRYSIDGGPHTESATDAVGYLSGSNATACVVATPRGLVTVRYDDVIAAKEVPPPPAPRNRLIQLNRGEMPGAAPAPARPRG